MSARKAIHHRRFGAHQRGRLWRASRQRKPTRGLRGETETPNTWSAWSLQVLDRSVLERVPAGQKYGFDHLMLDMLAHKESVHVERHSGYRLELAAWTTTCAPSKSLTIAATTSA